MPKCTKRGIQSYHALPLDLKCFGSLQPGQNLSIPIAIPATFIAVCRHSEVLQRLNERELEMVGMRATIQVCRLTTMVFRIHSGCGRPPTEVPCSLRSTAFHF